jgi:uncharacterized protein YjbJ (UPF0337 family)
VKDGKRIDLYCNRVFNRRWGIGNFSLEQSGGSLMMKRSTKDKAEGIFHELKGTIKSKAGKLTNNPGLEGNGIAEKISGKIQNKIGQVEKVIEKR